MVAAAVMLVVAVVAVAAVQTPRAYREWLTSAQNKGFAPEAPATLVGLSAVDPCVVGTWREVSRESYEMIDGVDVRFIGKGAEHKLGVDRTAVIDFGTGMVETGEVKWSRLGTRHNGRYYVQVRKPGRKDPAERPHRQRHSDDEARRRCDGKPRTAGQRETSTLHVPRRRVTYARGVSPVRIRR
jgi:hypothetical protein